MLLVYIDKFLVSKIIPSPFPGCMDGTAPISPQPHLMCLCESVIHWIFILGRT